MLRWARGQPGNPRRDCCGYLIAFAFIAFATGGCISSGGSRAAGSPLGNGRTVLAVPTGVDIAVKLDYLSRQNPSRVGRAPLVGAYEECIHRHPGDPRVAQAMMSIGHLYGTLEIPELDIHPDTEKAMEWFRMAARTATVGSSTWVDAQLTVARCQALTSPEEARNRLRSILDRESLLLARVEYELQAIAIRERNLDQAERHCRRLLSWYRDPSRIPKEDLIKHEVDCLMISSGAFMVHQIGSAHETPVAQRRARILQLMKDFAGQQSLYRDGSEALAALEQE